MIYRRDGAAALILATLGALFVNVEPTVAAAMDQGFHLGTRGAGIVLSAESAGAIAGSLLAFAAVRTIGTRATALYGLILYVLTNVTTLVVHSSVVLTIVRTCTGVAEGLVIAIAFALMASARTPHRLFGAFGMLQTGSAIGAFTLLAWLMHAFGWRAAFVVFAVAGVGAMLLLPSGATEIRATRAGSTIDGATVRGLLSVLVFFTAQTAIWPFLEHFGAQRGIGDFAIAGALSFGALCGFIGSTVVTVLPARFAGFATCAAAGALNILAILALAFSNNGAAFVVALGLFNFTWATFAPLQLSALRRLNITPDKFTMASTATTAGFALGPLIGGYAIHGNIYTVALGIGAAGTFLALALIASPLQRVHDAADGAV
ncbi:MAG TPA: MFS transporter [Candidatus Baltobacteraceae bacterium]|nr:MFS transporter [Candidatus Baltobacteraceae bacterium]